jgi:hypothetical protein
MEKRKDSHVFPLKGEKKYEQEKSNENVVPLWQKIITWIFIAVFFYGIYLMFS